MNGPSTLHLALQMDETAAPYHQHCLPLASQRHIGLCTYFPLAVCPPKSISAFHGDGTLSGFFRALANALDHGNYDILHVHNPHLGALLAFKSSTWRRRRRPPLVITVHNSYSVHRRAHRAMYLPTFAAFDGIVCCGRSVLRSFPFVFHRLAEGRLCAIQNGVDLERIDRLRASESPREFTVLSVARLVPVKRLNIAIHAFLEGAEGACRMAVVGSGPLQAELSAEAARMPGGERVWFRGMLTRDETIRQMKAADLFVSTSVGEGLPVAVLEAMACRLPVVLSDIPPHREIAGGADFIPIVAPGDVHGFVRETKRIREMSRAERAEIGNRCRNIVERQFSVRRMLAEYDEQYARVV